MTNLEIDRQLWKYTGKNRIDMVRRLYKLLLVRNAVAKRAVGVRKSQINTFRVAN